MAQDSKYKGLENDPSVKYGRFLAHPPPGEEICISGMSGKFPLSSNIDEYKYNLYNKVSMITKISKPHPEMPLGVGKMKKEDLEQFDSGFFGIPRLQAQTMNEIAKLLLECSVEAVLDAGLHPSDLEGTRTGVFVGICVTESECYWYPKPIKNGNAILGNMRSIIANRIMHFFKLTGYGYNCDTACSSTLYALVQAYQSIRRGDIDQALVAGGNSVLSDGLTLQFARLGVLSKEGVLRAFDQNGTGYVRSEAASAILLQKSRDCKRIYAKVLHSKTNCDGYKEQGITYPSGQAQLNLLKEIYLESGIDPKEVGFIEAHGTGTPVGDPEELNGIDAFFATGRSKPLLIGSVKSSIGHAEPVSGLCSIVKCILAFENNLIPPNINFKEPRSSIPGLIEGRLKVVVDNTPFPNKNGLIGASSFGFGGGNAHVLLKWNSKIKSDNGTPSGSIPRLILVSGRTKEAVSCLLNDVAEKFDVEHMALIYNSFRKPIPNHLYRGFVIASKEGLYKISVKPFSFGKNKFHIYFGGLSKTSSSILGDLLELPLLANLRKKIETFLLMKKIPLNALTSNSVSTKQVYLLTQIITQLSLAELLSQLDIVSENVSGNSFGELACAYFQKILSLEDVLMCVFVINEATQEIEKSKIKGDMNADIFNEYRNRILSEFKNIIKSPKYCNGCNGTEVKPKSAEYFVDALLNESQKNILIVTKSSVILEVGLGAVTTKKNVLRVRVDSNGGIQGVLEALGRLYECGMNPNVKNLYPKVEFPVSRGTPIISSKIKWNHDYKYFVHTFDSSKTQSEAMDFKIDLTMEMYANMVGHVVDGRNLFPATGYLYLAWFLFGEVEGIDFSRLQVVFENCRFKRACQIPHKDSNSILVLTVILQRVSGVFEISEGSESVVTGRIRLAQDLPAANVSNKDMSSETMLDSKDIYKELRLRGYHYTGPFKSLVQLNVASTYGKIRWHDDWVAFMDNMLQMKILSGDSRLLYVPIGIAKITLNPTAHLEVIESLKDGDDGKIVDVPVEYFSDTQIIRSGGIEIIRLIESSIPRKKLTALPVLEKYQFVPNKSKLSLRDAVRVFMQVALENNCGLKVKVAELVDQPSRNDAKVLVPIIQEALGDQPLVNTDITILSSEKIDVGFKVENKTLRNISENNVVVGTDLLSREEVLCEAIEATLDSGFILSREPSSTNIDHKIPSTLTLLNISETDGERLVFLRKKGIVDGSKFRVYINISTKNRTFDWLGDLKSAVGKDCKVVAWAQNEPLSGILGLVNCIRREPGCQNVKCVFIVDPSAPEFDPANPFYKKQLETDNGVNVYMNGEWGTYRHLLLENSRDVKNEHCFVNSTVRGDLSSIKWIEGSLTRHTPLKKDQSLIDVYYSSLNFRDVMTASGRINVDVITKDRREQECVQGFEFSGKTSSGQRVMGMISQGALATLVKADNNMLWDVPDKWSLEEAATVPVVYSTCLYALVVVGKIKPSDSILIHSGTGGIGQAAINLCLNMGCTVFTTVGTNDKRQFILKQWPQIDEKHIGNSRDISFEQMIMKQTNGRGVDIVLNSLAEEKLSASARCLAPNGRFLEIGKFDLANNNRLNLLSFKEGASYHGVMLDKLFYESPSVKQELKRLVQKYIDSGAITPLSTNVFEKNEAEQAFRFMAAGKHMGKVLVKIRNEKETGSHQDLIFEGLPRYYCDPDKSYIICGGLGGFGLELADWLILRGAKNLILTSRKGVVTGYQRYRISIWKSYSCKVNISTDDITTKSGCTELLRKANSLAPVAAIFNLAVVLDDAILENQTKESFRTSFGPKAYATEYLDELSRTMCPDLRDFVVFSSVSCGRGNAGQSNYGMSNSVMERICEKRHSDGLPALAIEWGAIGDVGLVAAMQEDHRELEIGGTLQQSISNCLQVMDVLIRQEEGCIVSSMVVAEKKAGLTSGNIEEVVGAIIGIGDIKSVSRHSTLAELGMDSMSAVEVKQTLERECNIFLSPSEMRNITLSRIRELQEESSTDETSPKQQDQPIINFKNIFNYDNDTLTSPICKLRSKCSEQTKGRLPKVIVIPGVEGTCDMLEKLTENLEVEAFGLNIIPSLQKETVAETGKSLLPYVKEVLQSDKSFHIIAHSVGTNFALEVTSELEKQGYLGTLTLLDGTPALLKKIAVNNTLLEGGLTDESIENSVISSYLRSHFAVNEITRIMEDVPQFKSFREKVQSVLSRFPKQLQLPSEDSLMVPATAIKKRYRSTLMYEPALRLKSKIRLYKPTVVSAFMDTDDCDLSQLCEQPVEVKVFEGTHASIVENEELAKTIMEDLALAMDF